MYLVEETFKYLVEDKDSFTSIEDVLDICNSFPACVWENTINPLPVSSNELSYPWGNSNFKVTDLNKIFVSAEKLAKLIRDSYTLNALQAGGVDNWEWYGDSISDYEKEYGEIDDKTDAEIIKNYLNNE